MDRSNFVGHRHPMNLRELLSGEESGVCGLCGKEVTNESAYECSQCNFIAHLGCALNPPLPVIDESKIHEQSLTLLPRRVSFICNACGLPGDKSPYVCLKCSFMIHGDCIYTPRVIRISRHDHRLSHTCFLGPGKWNCGVCRKNIDGKYGAYCCGKGCSYAVHSRCARNKDVSDGEDLEGKNEEEDDKSDKDLKPFIPLDEKFIDHFSHQHNLRLESEDGGSGQPGSIRCSACVQPIAFGPFYKCDDLCDFFLHKTCANLPRKVSTILHVHPLTLCTDGRPSPNSLSRCGACNLHFSGFRYHCLECKEDDIEFDVGCSSLSEPLYVNVHPHPLYVTNETGEAKICTVCNLHGNKWVLSCIECSFHLCVACANLPCEVIYEYDEHLLSYSIGEGVNDLFWCDICENKVDATSNSYKCFQCGPVLHTECVLGSFRNVRPGLSFTLNGVEYQVVLNDPTSTLPRCSQCHNDCHEPLLIMSTTTADVIIYFCSSRCFSNCV